MESQYILEAKPGNTLLVGPIDLSHITAETLPTILQRICDEIQGLKNAFAESEKKRQADYEKILKAIEDVKVCNEKQIDEYSNDAENLKTFMKLCKFVIAHPWLAALIAIGTIAVVDQATRIQFWGFWPK